MNTNNQTFQGKIQYVDVEGGYYTLVTPSGEVYKLEGVDKTVLQNGKNVEIEGALQKQSFGIGFGTEILKVHHIKVK